MLLRPLTVATGLLALPATQAFLLPPEVSEADVQIANTIESVSAQVAESQVVNVECPGCPILVQGRKDPKKSFQLKIHRLNHLELAFSVDHQPDHDRLLVNGFELYPSGDPLHEILSAPQVVDWDKRVKRHHREHDHDGHRGDRHGKPPHGDHGEHDRPDWRKPPHGDRPDGHRKPPHGDHGEHDGPDGHRKPPHGDRPDGHRKPSHGDHGEHDGPDGHRKPPHGDRPDGHRKPHHGDRPDGHRKPHHGDHGEHGHHGNHTDGHHERPHRLTPQPQRLGFGLQIGPSQKDADGQFELVEVELQIIEVGSAFIDGIPSVKVKLIKDGQGRLLMSQIDKSLPKYPNGPEDYVDECTNILCKWLAMAREKLQGLKGFGNCHGGKVDELDDHPHRPHHPHPPPPHHDPHHSHLPPPHHDPHHRPHHGPAGDFWPGAFEERRWGKLFKYIASHILLPVLIGIVAGVSVSLVGMAAGTLTIAIWRLLFRRRSSGHRRHHSGHAHHRAARKEVALSDEKSGLMAYQDEPPSYEDEEAAKPPQA